MCKFFRNLFPKKPTSEWYSGEMPTMSIKETILQFEERIEIHLAWIAVIEDDPSWIATMGDKDFHEWAIDGYENAIYYLERK